MLHKEEASGCDRNRRPAFFFFNKNLPAHIKAMAEETTGLFQKSHYGGAIKNLQGALICIKVVNTCEPFCCVSNSPHVFFDNVMT